jgi:hypothetical protein
MPKVRYIVRARNDNGALTEFLDTLQDAPNIELVDTIGPQNRPHTAVISVDPDQASQLEERLRNIEQLIIERDSPLQPL